MGDRGGQFAQGRDARHMGKFRLRFMQLLFGPLARSDIRHRADKFDATGFIAYRMRRRMDVLDRAVGQQQSILVVEILAITGGTVDGSLYALAVVGVNTQDDRLGSDGRHPVIAEYPEGFLRPDDFAGGDAPAEAAGVAQALCLGQIGFALLKRVLGLLAFGDVFARDQDDQPAVQASNGFGVFTNPKRRPVLADLSDLPAMRLADIFQAELNAFPDQLAVFL